MFFVYVLALVGLVVLVGIAIWVLSTALEEAPTAVPDDPYGEALTAAARLQGRAWEAMQDVRRLEDERTEHGS